MPTLTSVIQDLCIGDARKIRRFVTGVDLLDPISKAWLTVKRHESDTVSIFQKIITANDVNTQGQIIDDGSATGTAELLFRLGNVDTSLLEADRLYYFDISVKFDASSEVDTPERGVLIARAQITTDTV